MQGIQSSLGDILHIMSQGLLAPTLAILLGLALYACFSIGSVIVEFFSERKLFKISIPPFLAALMGANQPDIPEIVEEAGLLNRQKKALLTVYDYRMLPGDAFTALVRRLVAQEEARYSRITGRNNMAAKVAPMIGLMGTLIPLGPGIDALGRSDTAALSSSLLIAFDTTVAGLVVAAICLIVSKIRTGWYDDYMNALDSAMATMMEKVARMRQAGEITIVEPTDYAFMFEQKHSKGKNAANAPAALPLQSPEQSPAQPMQAQLPSQAAPTQMPAAPDVGPVRQAAGQSPQAAQPIQYPMPQQQIPPQPLPRDARVRQPQPTQAQPPSRKKQDQQQPYGQQPAQRQQQKRRQPPAQQAYQPEQRQRKQASRNGQATQRQQNPSARQAQQSRQTSRRQQSAQGQPSGEGTVRTLRDASRQREQDNARTRAGDAYGGFDDDFLVY